MKRIARLIAAAAAATLIPAALAAHTHVPTPSVWKLDVAASDFGGLPASKAESVTVTEDTEKWLKYTDMLIDSDGKTWKLTYSGPQNGEKRPLNGMPGATLSVNAADDTMQMIEADGTVIDINFSLSADRKTVTYDQTIKSKDGKKIHQKMLYRRMT